MVRYPFYLTCLLGESTPTNENIATFAFPKIYVTERNKKVFCLTVLIVHCFEHLLKYEQEYIQLV